MISLVEKLRTVADRNRPSRKPQLWEDFGLAARRRVEFEVSQRFKGGWLDQPRVVDLSQKGFDDGRGPIKMEIVPREVMNKALFLYGTFEISETRLVQSLLQPGMTFIDIGANIGYYTLIAARAVGPTGQVQSFEPNKAVRDRLSTNVSLNGFANVVVHDKAVTKTSGTVRFYVSDWNENTGTSSIVPGKGLDREGEDVPCVSLDDLAGSLGGRRIDLLKMDIEGAELDAIEGGRRLLQGADAPALLFESFEVGPLLAALRGLGYTIRRIHYRLSGGLELLDADSPYDSLFAGYESPNYFAVKDPAVLDRVTAAVNAKRSAAFQWLGRL